MANSKNVSWIWGYSQKIRGSLLNMWVHLYNHDDDGVDTLAKIFELNHRDLVNLNLVTTGFGNDLGATVTFCDQQFVTQHDLMKELAIHLNNKLPLAQRSRLFIDARGEDLPASLVKIQEAMQARILSISTGESFSSQLCTSVQLVDKKTLRFKCAPQEAEHHKLHPDEWISKRIWQLDEFGNTESWFLYETGKVARIDLGTSEAKHS